MPRKKKRDHDFSVTAFRVVQEATEQSNEPEQTESELIGGKNPHAVALGRLSGLKGEQRREIARKAALTRWHKSTSRD